MNSAPPGHPYIKSAIDMACWDLAAICAGRSLCDLLGGRTAGRVRLHSSIPSGTPAEIMNEVEIARELGYTFHSVKIGLTSLPTLSACGSLMSKWAPMKN